MLDRQRTQYFLVYFLVVYFSPPDFALSILPHVRSSLLLVWLCLLEEPVTFSSVLRLLQELADIPWLPVSPSCTQSIQQMELTLSEFRCEAGNHLYRLLALVVKILELVGPFYV